MGRSLKQSAARRFADIVITASLFLAVSACAEFSGWTGFDFSGDEMSARQQADAASLWEMTLMAGRYGVMLGQAREILKLPEPKGQAPDFPPGAADDKSQREALAQYQVTVAQEFFADAARACKGKRVPAKVRTLACKDQKQIAVNLRTPAPSDIEALSARNEQVGDVVMPWWNAVCAVAPKPKKDDDPVCAME